jgi:hypothetical protein
MISFMKREQQRKSGMNHRMIQSTDIQVFSSRSHHREDETLLSVKEVQMRIRRTEAVFSSRLE